MPRFPSSDLAHLCRCRVVESADVRFSSFLCFVGTPRLVDRSRPPAGFDAFVTAITDITTLSRVLRRRGSYTRLPSLRATPGLEGYPWLVGDSGDEWADRTARQPRTPLEMWPCGGGDRYDRRFPRQPKREVVGTGSLLEAREDQRSTAISLAQAPSPLQKLSQPPGL